jgi:hypothetical protein
MTTDTMPGDAEAAGAIAALADLHGWSPAPGAAVRVPRAFGGGYQDGVVATADRGGYLVDTPEGRLLMYREELIQR